MAFGAEQSLRKKNHEGLRRLKANYLTKYIKKKITFTGFPLKILSKFVLAIIIKNKFIIRVYT